MLRKITVTLVSVYNETPWVLTEKDLMVELRQGSLMIFAGTQLKKIFSPNIWAEVTVDEL